MTPDERRQLRYDDPDYIGPWEPDPTPEQEAMRRGNYGEIARMVDLCMWVSDRPCIGSGCDLDDPCPRHERTCEIAERYVRLTRLWGRK